MSLPVRVGTLLVAFLAVVGGAIFVVIHYFLAGPPVIDLTTGASGAGQQVSIVMQEDPQNTVTTKPDWVSYFIQDPKTKQWVHTTLFKVPAGATVNVTVLGYDGCTPAAQPVLGQGHRHDREHRDGRRQDGAGAGLLADLLGRAYVLDPRHRPQRADGIADDRAARTTLCAPIRRARRARRPR